MRSLLRSWIREEEVGLFLDLLPGNYNSLLYYVYYGMTDTSKYYLHTKEPLPMDIDFLVHDTYSMTRPQWKLASDLQEAARLFGEAVAQNYRLQDSERAAEPEDEDAESESSDEGLEEDAMPEVDEEQESSDEADVRTSLLF